jgi:hypothetical protein
MSDEAWYLQQVMMRVVRGEAPSLVEHAMANPEPVSNVHSIALARTLRAIEQLRRGRATPERPL